MAEAWRDDNNVTVLLWVSSVDNETPLEVQVDPSTWAILAET